MVVIKGGLRLINSDDDVTYMCELHAKWPTNEITLYVEPEVQLVAVEELVVEPDQPIVVQIPQEMYNEDEIIDSEEDDGDEVVAGWTQGGESTPSFLQWSRNHILASSWGRTFDLTTKIWVPSLGMLLGWC